MIKIPYYTKEKIIEALSETDHPMLIRDAYTKYYNSNSVNKKMWLRSRKGHDIIVMPFSDQIGIVINKVILMEKTVGAPGVFGWMTVYNLEKREPVAIIDATVMTGLRTAAKSLLISQIVFKEDYPKFIHIYGASTQAIYHYNAFSERFKNTFFYFIVRSEESGERLRGGIKKSTANFEVVCDQSSIGRHPDIIITATNSKKPIVNNSISKFAKMLICVGSSSGYNSEIDLDIVAASKIIVDSFISIEGKGELNLPLEKGVISKSDIIDLNTVLTSGENYNNINTPILFVSKGLAVEDYAFAVEIIKSRL